MVKKRSNKDKKTNSLLFQGTLGNGPEENKDYTIIPQNNATNQMARLNTKRHSTPMPLNQTKVTYKDITALFSGKNYGPQEAQFFDLIVNTHITDSNHDNNTIVQLSLKDYMKIEGKRSRPSAIKGIKKIIDRLLALHVSYTSKHNSKYDASFGGLNIFQDIDYGKTKRGYITANFTVKANQLITQQAMIMPYHTLMFRLDAKNEATAWYILRRLLENKRMNYNQERADKMKIATLLQSCPNLPTYGEVMKGNRNIDDRIIQPFFKAVERLSEAFDYTFITEDGKPFNYEEGIDYNTFANGELVITSWKDYPNLMLKRIVTTKSKHKRDAAKKHRQNKK